MPDWESFFKAHGRDYVHTKGFIADAIALEELYQLFKERLMDEVRDELLRLSQVEPPQ